MYPTTDAHLDAPGEVGEIHEAGLGLHHRREE
jgi:hypothetical protein